MDFLFVCSLFFTAGMLCLLVAGGVHLGLTKLHSWLRSRRAGRNLSREFPLRIRRLNCGPQQD